MKQIFLLYALTILVVRADPLLSTCPGNFENTPLLDDKPILIKQIHNGSYYQYKNQKLDLIKVEGSAEEMGLAAGKLLKEQIQQNVSTFNKYVEENATQLLQHYKIPEFLGSALGSYAAVAFKKLLSLSWFAAAPFIPDRFTEELEGMAKGSGVDIDQLKNFNMAQEVIQGKGASSFVSIVPKVDYTVQNDKYYTFRGLDWPTEQPITLNPLITVYKSSEVGSIPFTNVGYAGIIGGVTVVNSQGASITDKLWVNNNQKLDITYYGTPYSFIVRDLAQFQTTLKGMENYIQEAKRADSAFIGLGSLKSGDFNIAQYDQKDMKVYNDTNFNTWDQYFPAKQGIMYMNQYDYPNDNGCFEDILSYYLEERCDQYINLECVTQGIPQIAQVGTSQIVTSDLKTNTIYVAYSNQDGQPAYLQPISTISLNDFY